MKTIYFDLGGTILDSEDIFLYIAKQWNTKQTEKIKNALLSNFLKFKEENSKFRTVTELLSKSIIEVSKEFSLKDISSNTKKFYTEIYLNRVYLFEDSVKTLEFLKNRGFRLVVVSDADSDIVYPQLEKLNIKYFFSDFIISSDMKAYKPSKIIVNEAKKYCPEDKSNCFFVGDSKVDIETALQLGVIPIALSKNKKFGEEVLTYPSLTEFIINHFN